MTYTRPPYISQVLIQDWITKDKQRIEGIRIIGRTGIAGHLSANEARTLADTIHDLADKLDAPKPKPTNKLIEPQKPYMTALEASRLNTTVYVSRTPDTAHCPTGNIINH